MKLGKKLLSMFLSIVMLVSMLGTTALAAGSTNVEFTVDKSTAAVGDTITVVFKNKEMKVTSFSGGIMFDKDKLECLSVVGPMEGYSDMFGLTKKNVPAMYAWTSATSVSSTTDANAAGTVGFVVAGTSDAEYVASTLYTATFKVKAAGNAQFTLYEHTDGENAFESDSIETKSVTISGGTTPPVAESYTVTFDANGGSGTMAPVTVNKDSDGKYKYTTPACTFTAPAGKAFRAWQVGSEAARLCPAGVQTTLTGDTTLKALWGTPLAAANFTLSGYEIGSSVKSATLTMDETAAAALKPMTHGVTYGIGTGYSGTGLQGEITDASAKFEAGKTYYLAVQMLTMDDHSLNGLTKENVKLGSKAAEDLYKFGDGGYVVNAYFKLDPLTAHTHSYTEETVKAEALKSAATCQSKAVYYKSCSCGAVDKSETAATFEYGEKNPNNHIGSLTATWEKDTNKHWHVYSCCPTVKGAEAAHSFVNNTAATGALKSAADCMSKAVYYKSCSVCGQLSTETFESGEKDSASHATGCVEDTTAWQKDGTHHWHVYSKCGAVVAASKAAHSYTDGACVCGATHKDTQTITAADVSATYGDTDAKIVATAQTTLSYTVKTGDDVVDVDSDGKLTIKKAGEAVVTVTAAETSAYHPATKDVTVTVAKKEIEIAGASPIDRAYEKDNLTMDVGSVGFKGLVGTPTLQKGTDYTVAGAVETDSAASPKNYTITVTLKGILDTNYVLKSNTYQGTFTIYPADPTAPTGLTGKTGNKLSTVSLTEGWSWIAPDTTMSEAGEKQFAAKYVDSTGNYKNVASENLTVVVTDKATQTITANDVTFTYGETKSIMASTSGNGALSYAVKSGDAVTVDADGKLTFQKAGTATVTVTAAETADYAKAEKDVTVTVNKAALTVTAKNQSIYVNGTAPDLTAADAYTVDGLVTGDAAPTVALAYSETPDVTKTGSYDIIVTATADTDKYDLTTVDGKLTISNRPSSSGKTYAITVESAEHGAVKADRKNAGAGTKINVTVAADKGYTLETLTVLDKDGKEVKLTAKDGKYSFTMPASKVTVKATFAEDNSMLNFFVDVPADEYYADPVLWAAENGITGGVDATHFAPDATCTRAQAVTFLWRAAGCPAPKSTEMPFADVVSGSYYYDAVLWAVENGITKGTSETTFSPDAECSRAQIVTFLWRSQKSPAASAANPFADVSADAYYANAVLWAVKNGVTTGTAADAFSPDANCTRAQIVTFIYRCMK